jgi:hypothetical protein
MSYDFLNNYFSPPIGHTQNPQFLVEEIETNI